LQPNDRITHQRTALSNTATAILNDPTLDGDRIFAGLLVQYAISLSIRPVDDLTQYGVVDLWATPLMAFKSNAGDCEDYAIAKYVALHEIGFTDDDLRLLIVHLRATNEDHAVTAVRYEVEWLILDNRTLDIRQDANAAEFDPLFVVDGEGVKRMTKLASKPQDPRTKISPAAQLQRLSTFPLISTETISGSISRGISGEMANPLSMAARVVLRTQAL
jgi:Bacterial transglutaminase-like cysteine proteinase BTLCP